MIRPTKDRLDRIRDYDLDHDDFSMEAKATIKGLLAEIDALEAENKRPSKERLEEIRKYYGKYAPDLLAEVNGLQKERDQLRERVAKLRECVKHYSCQGCQDGGLSARCYAYKSCITLAADDALDKSDK